MLLSTGDIINYNRRLRTFLCSSASWTASECWWPPAVVFSHAPFFACSTITQNNIKPWALTVPSDENRNYNLLQISKFTIQISRISENESWNSNLCICEKFQIELQITFECNAYLPPIFLINADFQNLKLYFHPLYFFAMRKREVITVLKRISVLLCRFKH